MRVLLGAALLVACSREPPPVRPPLPKGAIAICETCVGTVENHRVGVSNIWERSLAGPDGVVKLRPAAVLTIWQPDDEKKSFPKVTVVVGSEVTIGEQAYRVLEVEYPKDKPGSVTLQKK